MNRGGWGPIGRTAIVGTDYDWDQSRKILTVYLTQSGDRRVHGNFCPDDGCNYIRIEGGGGNYITRN